MSVGEGKFLLYSHITPPLKAGEYRFTATQSLAATDEDGDALDEGTLTVEPLSTYVNVTSPRFQLPPDQVLSTYPPASSEGSYGTRLPQIVIKRRTLPWERAADPANPDTPWLALVVIAEGEAEVVLNAPVSQCVTPGVVLDGRADVATGNYLKVRKSIIDKVFPTRLDVPLLAHAREVDITDTELMMGDDDGFLAVVIANRLPVPGRDESGGDAPIRYLAALINLEGQFETLLPKAPPPVFTLDYPIIAAAPMVVATPTYDHVKMGTHPGYAPKVNPAQGVMNGPVMGPHADGAPDPAGVGPGVAADADHGPAARAAGAPVAGMTVTPDSITPSGARPGHWDLVGATSAQQVYAQMAAPFAIVDTAVLGTFFDPVHRFPVLLHWSFTSTGDVTFKSLMENLDNGLLGTLPAHRPYSAPATADDPNRDPQSLDGRLPLEVVETGHLGLVQRTRRGDEVRAWYRGPLLPHPADTKSPRLPLAHASDQLRTVIPDGREDLSLAVAFEVGRLLALSSPQVVAALLRWRQDGYQAARRTAIWDSALKDLDGFLGIDAVLGRDVGLHLGRAFAKAVVDNPVDVLGQPQILLEAGTPLPVDGRALDIVAKGLGLPALKGDLTAMLETVRNVQIPRVELADLGSIGDHGGLGGITAGEWGQLQDDLVGSLDVSLTHLTAGALSTQLTRDPVLGPTFTGLGLGLAPQPHRDHLDELLEHGPRARRGADQDADDIPDGTDEDDTGGGR
jgi:hypothetical protein